MPKPLLEWLVPHELNDMLHGIRASYFIRLQREDMVEFQQQRHHLPSQIRRPFFEVIQPAILLQGGKEEVESLTGSGLSGSSSSNFLSRSSKHWASGTALVATTRPTTRPQARWMGWAVRFRNTTETLQLPSLSSVYVLMTFNPLGRSALSSGLGTCIITFSRCPIIIVFLVQPWMMMMDWKPGIVHFSVSKTLSSRSKGFFAVLVRNLSLSARLVHRNWKPCVHSKVTLAACHSDGASCILVSFIVCITLLIVGCQG